MTDTDIEFKHFFKYYLISINDETYHAKVITSNKFPGGSIYIQDMSDNFHIEFTTISVRGEKGLKMCNNDIFYRPLCDFNTFFKDNYSKKLANIIKGCIQFGLDIFPDVSSIGLYDQLNIRFGGFLSNGSQYYYLSNIVRAYHKMSWIEKCLYGKCEEDIDYSFLDKKPELMRVIISHFIDSFDYKGFLNKYEKFYNDKCSSIGEFFNYLNDNEFFENINPWLVIYINEKVCPFCEHIIDIDKIKQDKSIFKIDNSGDDILIDKDKVIDNYKYAGCSEEGTEDSVIITNQMIYTMRFGMDDID